MGYPVVTINRNAGGELSAVQSWFLLNPQSTLKETQAYKDTKWYVPITYTTRKEVDFNFEKQPQWLRPNDKDCKI